MSEALAKKLLSTYDKDNNGLDAGEFNNVYKDADFQAKVNVKGKSAEQLFKEYDADGNKYLGKSELEALIKAHLK